MCSRPRPSLQRVYIIIKYSHDFAQSNLIVLIEGCTNDAVSIIVYFFTDIDCKHSVGLDFGRRSRKVLVPRRRAEVSGKAISGTSNGCVWWQGVTSS